jgi:hypothetical protein
MNQFCGHPTGVLDNGSLRLEYLTDVGPRLARLFFGKSDFNLLAEVPDAVMDTPFGQFQFMGGHRFWHSPEALPRTYIPDQRVTIETLPDGIRLSASTELHTGMAKMVELHLASDRAALTLRHEMRNDGPWSVELAPWCLTMFKQGGVVILPQPVGNIDPAGLLANRQLVLWPYTQVRDARLLLDDDFILLKATAVLPPCKIGYFNPHGWIGYWLDHTLFIKRYESDGDGQYPDGGCNTETYCNDKFVELETLGSLTKLAPGGTILHEERWEVYDSLDQPFLPESLQKRLAQI